MANRIIEQRLIDTNQRALIKYVIISDGTQEANTVLVDASTLRYALNTSGYIMTSNTDPKTSYGTTIRRIFGHGKVTGSLRLKWHGDANTEVLTIGTGAFDFNMDSLGGGVFNNTEANTNGDLLVSSVGLASGDAFTLVVDLRKNAADYDAGQTADPAAFNRLYTSS